MDLFLLSELVVVMSASIAVSIVFHKLKIPVVVGFLLTGILIGPGGLSLVKDTKTIQVLAEIGVVMLLFTIGIEFSLERLKKIRKNFWLGGGLQVFLTIAVVVLVLWAMGTRPRDALFYGFLVSLSSTAVVLKLLADRAEIDSPHGRMSLGILLFQDMALVPMIAVIPVLADMGSVSVGAVSARFALSLLAISAVFFIARNVMPRVLHLIVGTRIREVFVLAALIACLGMALLTSSLGLSLALGAFLAGIIISESEYSHQVVSDILPFKDLFNSIFFISIGMLLDTAAVWRQKALVLAVVASIVLIKALLVMTTVRILGFSSRIAFLTGMGLAQVGEFSFVLAGVFRANNVMVGESFQVFIASSILTILATPLFVLWAPRLAAGLFPGRKPKHKERGQADETAYKGHVIIAGYGLNGRNLARVLKETGLPYVVLELNPQTIKSARAEGVPIIFGDASSRTILRQAGIKTAKGLVLALSDPGATRMAVRTAKSMNPEAFIIVRTRYASEIEELFSLGAGDVIPEEFETSLEIFSRVLDKFHLPRNVINLQIQLVRNECYGMLRGTCSTAKPMSESVSDLLAAGTVETYFVPRGAWFAGKSLGEMDMRGKAGATVTAVVRGDKSVPGPGADFVINSGDILVIVADHKSMDLAFGFLDGRIVL